MIDAVWQARAVWAILLAAPVTAAVLVFISAPYGRQARGGWGPVLPGRLGWLAMEWPTLVVFGAVFLEGSHRHDPVPMLLAAMWLGHYVHRTLIFPWRLRSTKPIPVVVALLAMSFQALNSYANAAWIAELGNYSGGFGRASLWLGCGLFLVGQGINLHADTVLIGLRKPGETGYHIPRGGAFRWVTNANYLGEIVAWIGWAVATWSLAGLAFAAYTAANLAPRAATHHRWYQETFKEQYPAERKVLVPGLW